MNNSSWNWVFAQKKSDKYENFVSIDNRGISPPMGIDAAKKRLRRDGDLTPIVSITIHNIIENDNQVILSFIGSFLHDMPYYGINPTYQRIEFNGFYIFTFKENKIVKMVNLIDTHQLLVKMGEVVFNSGDEKQIQQYMEMLKRKNLTP